MTNNLAAESPNIEFDEQENNNDQLEDSSPVKTRSRPGINMARCIAEWCLMRYFFKDIKSKRL